MDTKIHFFSSFLQLNNCKQEMETTWLKFFLVEGCVKQTLGLVLFPKNGFRNQICVLLFLFIIFFCNTNILINPSPRSDFSLR